MINPYDIKIQSNFVLVLPDKDFETYQFNGKETGILAASYKYDEKGNRVSTEQEHISISGTVYAVCDNLCYNGREIWHLQDTNGFRRGAFVRQKDVQHQIDVYRYNSVQYDVPIEVRVGDKVYFEYLAHMLCEQDGRWIMTSKGLMMMIKYDMLILATRSEHVIPLNGYMLVENEPLVIDEVEPGIQGTVRESGIVLLATKTEKRNRNRAKGKVISAGEACRSYLDFRGCVDSRVKQGDTILYDPRFAKELEYGLHRIFSEKKLLRIQRKDVYAVLDASSTEIGYI